jgi:hypothetical protein
MRKKIALFLKKHKRLALALVFVLSFLFYVVVDFVIIYRESYCYKCAATRRAWYLCFVGVSLSIPISAQRTWGEKSEFRRLIEARCSRDDCSHTWVCALEYSVLDLMLQKFMSLFSVRNPAMHHSFVRRKQWEMLRGKPHSMEHIRMLSRIDNSEKTVLLVSRALLYPYSTEEEFDKVVSRAEKIGYILLEFDDGVALSQVESLFLGPRSDVIRRQGQLFENRNISIGNDSEEE